MTPEAAFLDATILAVKILLPTVLIGTVGAYLRDLVAGDWQPIPAPPPRHGQINTPSAAAALQYARATRLAQLAGGCTSMHVTPADDDAITLAYGSRALIGNHMVPIAVRKIATPSGVVEIIVSDSAPAAGSPEIGALIELKLAKLDAPTPPSLLPELDRWAFILTEGALWPGLTAAGVLMPVILRPGLPPEAQAADYAPALTLAFGRVLLVGVPRTLARLTAQGGQQ